jgi:Zn-dependent protease
VDISPEKVRQILISVLILVVSVALHEFGHAIMADKLGDDTPRRQGRVTLNPLAHADPIGTLLLPLMSGIYAATTGFSGGFGWGRPVQWQPRNVRRGIRMSTASILVAVAGPTMNILLGTVIAFVHTLLVVKGVLDDRGELSHILGAAASTNFILFFFNLIPAPPLDGGHVAANLMPYKYRGHYDAYARFGPFVLLAVAMIPALNQIFVIPADFCLKHVYSLAVSLLG